MLNQILWLISVTAIHTDVPDTVQQFFKIQISGTYNYNDYMLK